MNSETICPNFFSWLKLWNLLQRWSLNVLRWHAIIDLFCTWIFWLAHLERCQDHRVRHARPEVDDGFGADVVAAERDLRHVDLPVRRLRKNIMASVFREMALTNFSPTYFQCFNHIEAKLIQEEYTSDLVVYFCYFKASNLLWPNP